ncbi:MAG: hypothetical protein GXP52_09480 [Deltaproteobacteria bacterium]|nr:hypothetical protein [Deltaproteobacteria bacterium]
MADAPYFSIDNSYEREQNYDPNGWIVTETFKQDYSLDWGVTFSDRLDMSTNFELTMEDVHNSDDVDTKNAVPHLDLSLVNPQATFDFTAEDTIDLTNEFNTNRKDAIDLSTKLSLTPIFLPSMEATYEILTNDQENLEDTLEKKLDMTSSYSFGEMLDLDASWKQESLDDRLNSNSDTEDRKWDFNLSLNRLLTDSLKLNFDSSWTGEQNDILNNAGAVISRDPSKTLKNKLLFTLDTFPQVNSDLELTYNKNFVEDTLEGNIKFSSEMTQEFLSVGSLTETLDLKRNRLQSPVPQDDEKKLESSFTLEFAGTPSKYLDYSIKQNFDWTNDDFADGSLNTDTRKNEFDLSATIVPMENLTFDVSYNQSSDHEKGTKTGESSDFKLKMTYEGETLNVPNLVFEPSLELSTETNFAANDTTSTDKVDLKFTYEFILPEPFTLIVEPDYTLSISEGEKKEETFTLDYEMSWDFKFSKWTIFLDHTGTYKRPISSTDLTDEPTFDGDFDAHFTMTLAGNVDWDVEYKYMSSSDRDNEDTFEASLDWALYNMTFSLSAKNGRTFSALKDVTRTYTAEFSMEF